MEQAQVTELKLSGPQYAILSSQKSRNLFMAGQGGGKTWLMALISKYFIENFPNVQGIIGANTFGQLSDTTLKEIFEVWAEKFKWVEFNSSNPHGVYVIDRKPPAHFVKPKITFKSNKNKLFFANGCVVMTVSLEKYKAIEGRNAAWSLLDETADTKEEAIKTVITGRLRQKGIYINNGPDRHFYPFVSNTATHAGVAINPLYIFTKPAKIDWLNKFFGLEKYEEEISASIYKEDDFFFHEEGNKCIVISNALHNQENLPENYIQDRISEMTTDEVDRLIYGSPFTKTGNEYYISFQKTRHVKKLEYTPDLPLHISWDFNVNPYMSLTVWQIVPALNRIKARCLMEYALKSPKNNIEDVCEAFVEDWGHLCDPGLYFYGDTSGKNKEVFKDARSKYAIVEKALKDYLFPYSRRLLKQNPRHRSIANGSLGRRQFMNNIFKGKYDVDVEIDEGCTHLIADLEHIKENNNGAKFKKVEIIDGISCEKYGHQSDTADAFFCYNWGNYIKEKVS